MVKNKKSKLNKKYVALGLVILGALIVWYAVAKNGKSFQVTTSPTTQTTTEPEEPKPTPSDPEVDDDDDGSWSSSKNTVAVVMTNWGKYSGSYEVSAYAKILENSGACKLTFSRGSESYTVKRQATANVSDMSCGTLAIDLNKLSPGSWTVTVSYESSQSKGSTTKTLEV